MDWLGSSKLDDLDRRPGIAHHIKYCMATTNSFTWCQLGPLGHKSYTHSFEKKYKKRFLLDKIAEVWDETKSDYFLLFSIDLKEAVFELFIEISLNCHRAG